MKAIVLANGECPDRLAEAVAPEACDQVICVDGGLRHCLRLGWTPSLLIGDFDSVPEGIVEDSRLQSVNRLTFPASKDTSDLELALDHLAGEPVSEVILLGISGGRTDHMLFNWLLPARREWPFLLRLIDQNVVAVCASADYPCHTSAPAGMTVSLLALNTCRGITTAGLAYPLVDAEMMAGSTLGLSNVSDGGPIEVTLKSGRLLVLRAHDAQPPEP